MTTGRLRYTIFPAHSIVLGLLLLLGAFGARGHGAEESAYQLCNNTSYVIDAALAIEVDDATATQGWFRVFPGSCRSILSNINANERYFLHTRTPAIYDKMPEPAKISRMLCIGDENFLIAGAEACPPEKGTLAPFLRVFPDTPDRRTAVTLTEAADYSSGNARMAGIKRLLTLAGFDPGPIDGQASEQTETALKAMREAHNVAPDATDAVLFATLMSAALNAAASTGLTVCNGTDWRILAASAIRKDGTTTTQGWFPLPANRCTKLIRDELTVNEIHLYAEAVDRNGRPISVDGQPVRWQGKARFCTKSIRFAITDHTACEQRGLEVTAFRRYDLQGAKGRVVWLREGE